MGRQRLTTLNNFSNSSRFSDKRLKMEIKGFDCYFMSLFTQEKWNYLNKSFINNNYYHYILITFFYSYLYSSLSFFYTHLSISRHIILTQYVDAKEKHLFEMIKN